VYFAEHQSLERKANLQQVALSEGEGAQVKDTCDCEHYF
jgi:hypothetical protein